MKISWIKFEDDNKNFMVAEKLGMDVFRLENPEEIDSKINELVNKKYNMVVISNEMAVFSEDIIKKYKYSNDINILISTRK